MEHEASQRITRLTPLDDVLTRIAAAVAPVPPVSTGVEAARWRIAAEDPVAPAPHPAHAVALRDGYAVRSEATADASAYAPMPLADARAIEVGEPLPAGADAVAPADAVLADAAGVQAVQVTEAGGGTLPPGADAHPARPIRIGGKQLRPLDVAVLAAAGIGRIAVRAPRVEIIAARKDRIVRQVAALLEGLIADAGGDAFQGAADAGIEMALRHGEAHFTIVVGGSGQGRHDRSVAALARAGRVEVHGVAIAPGETAAFGAVEQVPVLVLPGRIDAALAGWLTLGAAIMRALTGATDEPAAISAVLERKVASAIGLVEVVPVRVQGGRALPLASGYLPLQALAQANGYIVVPAGSEGFPEGATVAVRPMP